jgi:gliding motility-associated-like protein
VIEGIEKFPNNEVQIYNRWGDKIREFENYDNKNTYWDGTYLNDNPVPDGTYYFIVSLKNVKLFTGWVHIRNEK